MKKITVLYILVSIFSLNNLNAKCIIAPNLPPSGCSKFFNTKEKVADFCKQHLSQFADKYNESGSNCSGTTLTCCFNVPEVQVEL